MQHPQWKIERLLELGRKGNVTAAQIAERLGLENLYVIRTLRKNGIEPIMADTFSWTRWLAEQKRKDAVRTGRKARAGDVWRQGRMVVPTESGIRDHAE